MTREIGVKETWRIKAISAHVESSDIVFRLHFGDRYMTQIAWDVMSEEGYILVNLHKATLK